MVYVNKYHLAGKMAVKRGHADGVCKEIMVVSPKKKQEYDRDMCEDLLKLEERLCGDLSSLVFSPPVTHIYNPLIYAKETHEDFIRKYCKRGQKVLFLGMNPGPFGMAQNGVPFGDTEHVKGWLKIKGCVNKPAMEHTKRPIEGLDCKRAEVSGSRLWGFLKEHSESPEVFFAHCFIHNYCPLIFMASSGKNITPPELPKGERDVLLDICDKSLRAVVKLTGVQIVVGVGKFAEKRACKVLKDSEVRIYSVMHPSPASPAANKGWSDIALNQLESAGLMGYITGTCIK